MKLLMLLVSLLFISTVNAGFEGLNGATSLGLFSRVQCSTGLTCAKGAKGTIVQTFNNNLTTALTGDGGDALSGFLQNSVTATATTITAAQCGSTFVNSGAVQMELPEASTVIGCRLTFITGNATNFDINPDDADQILVETDAAGDAIRNAVLGNSIIIEAISASQWAPVGTIGVWADIN